MKRDVLENLLAEGLSLDSIAERVHRSPSTVSYWLGRHGLQANGRQRYGAKPALDRAELSALCEAGLSVPEIARRLECTASLVRRYLARYELASRQSANRLQSRQAVADGARVASLHCKHHGAVDHVLEGRGSYRCMQCRVAQVADRRRRIKRRLVSQAGGACIKCGYDRCDAALQFHHLDPKEKEFHLSHQGIARSWERALAEASKCILLCANCHAEIEVGFDRLEL